MCQSVFHRYRLPFVIPERLIFQDEIFTIII
jgi:hypothetical protein